MAPRFIGIPRKKAGKAHSGGSILDLPGEIRTMIYVHLFEHQWMLQGHLPHAYLMAPEYQHYSTRKGDVVTLSRSKSLRIR